MCCNIKRKLAAGSVLSNSIEQWLAAAPAAAQNARAIISPYVIVCCRAIPSDIVTSNALISTHCRHAGLRYCGHVMAYAYKQINPQNV